MTFNTLQCKCQFQFRSNSFIHIDLGSLNQPFQKLFLIAGGRLVDRWEVEDVVAVGDGVEVKGPRGVVRARSVVLCPGPWAGPLLAKIGVHIPLK